MTAPGAARPPRPPLSRRVVAVLLVLVIGTALAAELRSFAQPDTGFLLDLAGRVLDGARLYVDVVEINPPLIVALNLPAVLVARATGLSDILVYRLGVTLVLLGALALGWRWLRKALPEDVRLRRGLLLLLAFASFQLVSQDYGEREHLVFVFLVPYLLLAAVRAEPGRVGRAEAAAVGLLAGLALALKPHFLLVWVAVEAWLRLGRRVAPRRPLPETVAIAAFLAAYGIAIAVVTPQYFALLRLLAVPYSRFLFDPFLHLLITAPGAALTLVALLAFVALKDHAGHPALWRALALGTLACFLAGAAQQKGLGYHFYPSLALATVLLGLVVLDARRPWTRGVRRLYAAVAAAALAATVAGSVAQSIGRVLHLDRAAERQRFAELVQLVKVHAEGEPVFVMSYNIASAYPLLTQSGAPSASRFGHLWILAADYLERLKRSDPLRYRTPAEMSPSERYLNASVREDLERNRPKLLVVLRSARDRPQNGYRRLDYVAYFRRDARIARLLDQYQWLADAGEYSIYQRVPEGTAHVTHPPLSGSSTRDVVGADLGGVGLHRWDPMFLLSAIVFAGILALALRREGAGRRSA